MTPPVIERDYRCAVCFLPCPADADTCGSDTCKELLRDYEDGDTVYTTGDAS